MANVKITDLAAYTNPDSTDVLPIVDVGAGGSGVTKKVSIADLLKNAGSGTADAPGIAFDGDSNTGIYRPDPDKLAISTNGQGRLFVDGSGLTVENGAIQLKGTTYTDFSDYWGSGDNQAIFTPFGYLGSNGAFAVSLYCNGYRNASSGFTYLGINGNTSTACGIDLEPDGDITFRSGTASGTVLPSRMTIDSSGVVELSGDLNIGDKITHIGNTNTAIRFPANDEFSIETAGSERLRISSGGSLLVGTSSTPPAVEGITPQVVSSSSAGAGTAQDVAIYNFQNASGSGRTRVGPKLFLGNSRSGTNGAVGGVVINNDHVGNIRFAGDDGAKFVTAAEITGEIDDTPGTDDMPGRLVFSTTADGASSPTERMRITSGGEVWINTTTGNANETNFGTVISANGNIGLFYTSRDVGSGGIVAGFWGNAGNLFVNGDGDCENTNNSYTGTSDIKLKENIVDANSQWDDLKALQVRNYNFKAETGYNTHTQIGLIAQEVELVSPGLVGESIDEETGESTKSVNYSVLYMKAVKALQEAMERIEILEQRLTDAGIA